MFEIENLKDYIYILNDNEFYSLAHQIYQITDFLCNDYPNYKEWYFNKQLPGIFSKERAIFFVRTKENEIIAVTCLKKTEEEQKICTLYVVKKYRNQHIGTKMVEAAIRFLETSKPLITFKEHKLAEFQFIIDKYNWQLTDIIDENYEKEKEFCFNRK